MPGPKQVTYAHKRSRCHQKSSENLPTQPFLDPNVHVTRHEMTKRMLQRSCLSSSNLAGPLSVAVSNMQTPHPTMLSEAQAFKLPSSRGQSPASDHQLSPVPSQKSLPLLHNRSNPTSSRAFKENAVPPSSFEGGSHLFSDSRNELTPSKRSARSKSRARGRFPLASPFTSQPSSPQSKGGNGTNSARRGPLDTLFDPNIQNPRNQPRTTTNSPTGTTKERGSLKARRPSAPSTLAQHPDLSLLFESTGNPIGRADLQDAWLHCPSFDLGVPFARRPTVDFNRPPSQLSFTSTYDEKFFDDAIAYSTPPSGRNNQRRGLDCPSPVDHDDDDEEDDDELSRTHLIHFPPEEICSPIQDSIFSSLLESAYSTAILDEDADMDGRRSSSLGLGNFEIRKRSDCSPKGLDDGAMMTVPGNNLEVLLNKLDIGVNDPSGPDQVVGYSSSPPNTSLEHEVQSAGRNNNDNLEASPVIDIANRAKRTRSGTIVQSHSRFKRGRSDTIIARPMAPAATERSKVISPDLSGNESNASRHVISAVPVAEEEELDDELLLDRHWVEEDWAVAPPSPVQRHIKRPKSANFKEWKKGWKAPYKYGTWAMRDHEEDDGEDDPLLLK